MRINRTEWMKKIGKLTHRLNKFSTAIACEKRFSLPRFIKVVEVFQKTLEDLKITLKWEDALINGTTTMDLRSYQILMSQTTGTSDFVWHYEEDKKKTEVE